MTRIELLVLIACQKVSTAQSIRWAHPTFFSKDTPDTVHSLPDICARLTRLVKGEYIEFETSEGKKKWESVLEKVQKSTPFLPKGRKK